MENNLINFDRRFHKVIFFRRLGIAIYSLAGFILSLLIFFLVNDIQLATKLLFICLLTYILGFIIYSIILLLTDKKIVYDINKVNKGYKIGFIITKTMSYITISIGSYILFIFLFIGLLASAFTNLDQYDEGNLYNQSPDYVYNYEEFKEIHLDIEVYGIENADEFIFAQTTTTRFLRSDIHTTMQYSFIDITNYLQTKNELFNSNKLLNKTILDKEGNYVYPLTNFEIEGYKLFVVNNYYLDNLHIIGYNDVSYSLVELKSESSYYSHFGDDVEMAEKLFVEYVTNVFYLPWCEEA